ncbi:MAG: transposase [Armatimonadota bacterium]
MPNWPHAPVHQLTEAGAYMVTAGTFLKHRYFDTPERLQLVHDMLLNLAADFAWQLEAWAVFSNHYHFVSESPADPSTLSTMLSKLHTLTSTELNRLDGTPGRQVWFQFWDTRLTYQRSYLARLQYVHTNAVHHRLVQRATDYRWCSAAWFERIATPAFRQTLANIKIDRITVRDDFEV